MTHQSKNVVNVPLMCPVVIFKAQKLLILSDVEFMKTMSDYFTAAFDPNKTKKEDSTKDTVNTDLEKTLTEDTKPKLVKQDTVLAKKKKKSSPLPKMKINASIRDLRVALIENVDTPQPQALTLKVSSFIEPVHCWFLKLVHMRLFGFLNS